MKKINDIKTKFSASIAIKECIENKEERRLK